MSEADSPEVIQGRLGWEPGDVSEANPEGLEPHPKNREIYGDTGEAEGLNEIFKESVAENGVLEPLVITKGKKIVSGHRRWLAAKDAGLDTVPVRYTEFEDELAEREALVEFNRQREKTPGQIVNEFEEMFAIERERAKERQANAGAKNLPTTDDDVSLGNVSQTNDSGSEERARDKAAEKVNADVSGRTLEKGLSVKEAAEGGDEEAQQAWEGLKSGDESFHGAYERVSGDDAAEDGDGAGIEPFTSQKTDEWSSPREIVEPLDEAIGGFDLDPCSGAESSPFAAETYTESDDGLSQPWHGSVWVNPPYSGVSEWVEKAAFEVHDGDAETVVFLCKGDSSTEWWHCAVSESECVLAIDRRLSFGSGDNSAPFASHVIIFGEVSKTLVSEMEAHGEVLVPLTGGSEIGRYVNGGESA